MQPDRISPDDVIRDLPTKFIGQYVLYYSVLDSTMEAARREAQWGAPAGTVVIADEQTEGKGRLQRTWLSPFGSLAMSIILRPNLDYLPSLIMLSSLAVAYSIEEVTGLKPQIKWPNDILIKEKKVSGILIQNDIRRSMLCASIIGIGINVNMQLKSYPVISGIATSLSDEAGKPISRLALLRSVLIKMEELYKTVPQGDSVFKQWQAKMVTLGQRVLVIQDEKRISGVAEAVKRDGSLILRRSDGERLTIVSGDVSLRPTGQGLLTE